jgi:hypothetical protein
LIRLEKCTYAILKYDRARKRGKFSPLFRMAQIGRSVSVKEEKTADGNFKAAG